MAHDMALFLPISRFGLGSLPYLEKAIVDRLVFVVFRNVLDLFVVPSRQARNGGGAIEELWRRAPKS